jgi:hypothetical protein
MDGRPEVSNTAAFSKICAVLNGMSESLMRKEVEGVRNYSYVISLKRLRKGTENLSHDRRCTDPISNPEYLLKTTRHYNLCRHLFYVVPPV